MGPTTLAGFIAWIRASMGITTTVLPDSSTWITFAYSLALDMVNADVQNYSQDIYTLMVYNLGGSYIVNFAQDVSTAIVAGSNPPAPFFANLRQTWNINGFNPGVIQSSSDEGTSQSFVVSEAAKTFSLADIQQLKDPYGRTYLQFAQQIGTLWGIS
jgi:hypothetical protein